MSQESQKNQLEAQTQDLVRGPLQHIRSAALAAALLPLASVAAAPAAAQSADCASAGMGGYVWHDANRNGLQDAGETGISNAVVSINGWVTSTGMDGLFYFSPADGPTEVAVQIPPGTEPSPPNVGVDDTIDSDGVPDGLGNSVAVTFSDAPRCEPAFGFFVSPVAQPGTGTPGYWKNHPEAWPVMNITVGDVTYTREQALALLQLPGKDRRLTMFSSLVPAMLNLVVGNNGSCVESTIAAADAWMKTYGPLSDDTKSVHAASYAWKVGEPLHRLMDNYNNGMLCAPHRD